MVVRLTRWVLKKLINIYFTFLHLYKGCGDNKSEAAGGILYGWNTGDISNIVSQAQLTRPDSIFDLKFKSLTVLEHLSSGEPRLTVSEIVYVWWSTAATNDSTVKRSI